MTPPTFQDLLDDYAEDIFIGRSEQLRLFERVLTAARPPCLILAVAGQGGVGKSTLLERFRRIAEEQGTPAALVNEDQSSLLAVLASMAEQFRQQSYACTTFDERYKKYRTLKEQVEADPHAPKGMLDFAVRSATRIGIKMARRVPLVSEAADVLLAPAAEDQIVEESSALASYLAQKFTNKDERVLLLETDEQLTTHWVTDLHRHGHENKVVLLFDTYEKTSPYLDHWLRDLLAGKFGDLPGNIRLVIAGRYPLEQPWTRFRRATQQVALEPFTEEEARKYLAEADITDEQTVATYLRLSERLPVLLALLVASPGDTPADLSADSVERFLQGLHPAEREAALLASVPRFFNRDILVALLGDEAGATAFAWLSEAHFVRQAARGWVYHDVVRTLLLRYVRQRSAQECKNIHRKLADYYHQQAADLQLPADQQRINANWREYEDESVYHNLSANPPVALVDMWTALLLNLLAAELPSITEDPFKNLLKIPLINLKQVFDETADAALKSWVQAGNAALQSDDPPTLRTLFQRLSELTTLTSLPRSVAYMIVATTYGENANGDQSIPYINKALTLESDLPLYYQRRGEVYYRVKLYLEALADFNKAIEFQPDNSHHYLWRGATHYQLKSYEVALADFVKAIELLPDKASNYYWRGRTYYQIKTYEVALADFVKAIELLPEDGYNYHWRGCTHYQLKAYDAALVDLTKAVELLPEYSYNYFWRGRTHYQLKAYDAALVDLTKAVELLPEYSYNYFWRGRTHYQLKAYDAALVDLTKAVELQPKDGNNYFWRGLTHYQLKTYDAALVDLTKAIELQPKDGNNYFLRGLTHYQLKTYDAALVDLTKAVELLPEYSYNYFWRGRTHYQLKAYDAALVDLTKAVELLPEYSYNYFWRGRTHYQLKAYDAALVDLTKAVELQPKDGNNYFWRGLTHYQLKTYDAALVDLTKAIELQPKDGNNYFLRGLTHYQLKTYDAALVDLTKAVELLPEYSYNYFWRGRTHYQLKAYDAALVDLTKAVELQPKDGNNYFWRGLTHYQLKTYDAALVDLTKAIELQPKDGNNYFLRGLTHYQLKTYDAALVDLTKAIELLPKDGYNYHWRGRTHYQLKAYDAALVDFSKAVELQPNNGNNHRWHGRSHYQIKAYDAALVDFSKAVELQPNNGNNHRWHGRSHYQIKAYDAALVDLNKAIELQPDNGNNPAWRGAIYLALGDTAAAEADFAQVEALLDEAGAPAYVVAAAYVRIDQVDTACRWLRLAGEREATLIQDAQSDADFDAVRDAAVFIALVAEFGRQVE